MPTPTSRHAVVFLLSLPLAIAFAGCADRHYLPPDDPNLPFSKGVLVGSTFYVAGHLGVDPDTGLAPADPAEEARLLFDGFVATLARVGMTMDDLVTVLVFCSDVGLYNTFNTAYRKLFCDNFPTRAFIGSGTLLRGARFEMTGTAVRR